MKRFQYYFRNGFSRTLRKVVLILTVLLMLAYLINEFMKWWLVPK